MVDAVLDLALPLGYQLLRLIRLVSGDEPRFPVLERTGNKEDVLAVEGARRIAIVKGVLLFIHLFRLAAKVESKDLVASLADLVLGSVEQRRSGGCPFDGGNPL